MRQVFLDHQSTTPVLPEVLAAMLPFFGGDFGAPSSLHHHGLRARDALAQARSEIAALINAESPEEIIFTSGATESANLAVKGTALARQRLGNHIVVSATEHLSVLNSVELLERQGFTCARVRVNEEGLVDPDDVRAALTDQTILICVHHVNHELGSIQPIQAIGQLAAQRGISFFVDAVADGGWLPIDAPAMGATLLSLSPHRFYGPKGVEFFIATGGRGWKRSSTWQPGGRTAGGHGECPGDCRGGSGGADCRAQTAGTHGAHREAAKAALVGIEGARPPDPAERAGSRTHQHEPQSQRGIC